MEMIQCAEDEPEKTHLKSVIQLLDANPKLHLYSLWYWASIGSELQNSWEMAPEMRAILRRRRELWEL